MLPPNPKATKNVANHPIYWWKISLVKMLLAEILPSSVQSQPSWTELALISSYTAAHPAKMTIQEDNLTER